MVRLLGPNSRMALHLDPLGWLKNRGSAKTTLQVSQAPEIPLSIHPHPKLRSEQGLITA